MANWCYNTLKFEVNEGVKDELMLFFTAMAEQEVEQGLGQLPDGYHGKSGYFFEIEVSDERIFYLTKWAPNLQVLMYITMRFQADFVYKYEELAMGIYGEASYASGVLTDICLEAEDFGLYDYNEESDSYTFEGVRYDSDYEILDILLERKKVALSGDLIDQ